MLAGGLAVVVHDDQLATMSHVRSAQLDFCVLLPLVSLIDLVALGVTDTKIFSDTELKTGYDQLAAIEHEVGNLERQASVSGDALAIDQAIAARRKHEGGKGKMLRFWLKARSVQSAWRPSTNTASQVLAVRITPCWILS